jgi:hypothetical protein
MRTLIMTPFAEWNWVLGAIVALGVILRVWGMTFGLPYMTNPDEGAVIFNALRFLHSGNLSPDFFHWPSLILYLHAALYAIYFLFGRLSGRFESVDDLALPDQLAMAVGKAAMPEQFILGRAMSVAFGVLAVIAVYGVCRQMHAGRLAGWIAALFLSVEPVNVRYSQIIRPDIAAVFFAVASMFFALKILDDPRPRHYLLAGAFAGLAASSKYNAALIFVSIFVAHFFCFQPRGLLRKEIIFAAMASAGAFFLGTPFALLEPQRFLLQGLFADAIHYATGHAGAEGNSLQWYVSFLWSDLGGILVLALGQFVLTLARRDSKGWALFSFALVYFGFVNLYQVHFDATILPAIPFLFAAAALFLVEVYNFLIHQFSQQSAASPMALGALVIVLALPMLSMTVANDTRLLLPDGRDTAREWIDANLPVGSRIALEAYSPYVNRQHFMVEGFEGLIDHPPEWYAQNGFEYLVFSYGTYGRYYESASRYPEYIRQYEAFFARFPEAKRFNDGGYEIRIHQTGVTDLPTQRVAARFGIYSNWIEFVGYDSMPVQTGQPLNLALYWRALETRRERLTLTTRLLDNADREIAQLSGALFDASSGRWQEGIVRVPWTIAAPDAPGMYRLELDVDAEGLGRVPVLSQTRQPISDKLFLDPFKVAPTPPTQAELDRARRANVRFGDAILLLCYSLRSGSIHPGDSLLLTLYWKSEAKMGKDYTAFVHLLDVNGNVRAQIDTQPRGGMYPTLIWDAGEIVRDDYALVLPRDFLPGEYEIEIGFYEYPGLTRLAVADAEGNNLGDHLVLPDAIRVGQ